ncbi:MAG: hypothetical protein HC822_04165 [Oscillochloris sp.]|nr:hypothetical protein [Oscillochloris sp.]
MLSLPPVLVYSKLTIGHRQIYCNVLAGYFLDHGHAVTIAVGVDADERVPYIEALRGRANLQIVYLDRQSDLDAPQAEIAAIRRLQDPTGLTFFPDGDQVRHTLKELARLGQKPEFVGRIEQLFLHHGSLAPWLRRGTGLKPHVSIGRRLRELRADLLFFRRYLSQLPVDVVSYSLDPRFVGLIRHPQVRWLPDIYRAFEPEPDAMAQDDLLAAMQEFLHGQSDQNRDILLYYGTNQDRRGYEWLLRLAVEQPATAVLHCGKLNLQRSMSAVSQGYRERLQAQGRMFETAGFITDERVTAQAYQSCKYVLLPYIGHYGSSGIQIQAASYGRPSLLPDDGLMAYWARRFHCGLTFRSGSYPAFAAGYSRIRQTYQQYGPATPPFVALFSKANLYRHLDTARLPARPPVLHAAPAQQ